MPYTPSYGTIPVQCLSGINKAVNMYGLTGTLIKANADASGGVAGLIATIQALANTTTVGPTATQAINQIANALKAAQAEGILTDSNVNALTTANTAVAGLEALFAAFDPSITSATLANASILGT